MSMTSSRPYMLRALYDWIVDNDCTPYLSVDATLHGVDVPDQFAGQDQVVLNLAPMAIRELDISNEMVVFLARFGGRAFHVRVPVGAVMAIYAQENGQGMVFEVEAQSESSATPEAASHHEHPPQEPDPNSSGKPPKGRPSLKIVK